MWSTRSASGLRNVVHSLREWSSEINMSPQSSRCGCPGSVPQARSRREFLQTASTGFGWLALTGMLADRASAGGETAPAPHFAPRAKHVILCFMDGGPSHVDSFDYKPELANHQDQAIGEGAVSKLSQSAASRVWLGSPWE